MSKKIGLIVSLVCLFSFNVAFASDFRVVDLFNSNNDIKSFFSRILDGEEPIKNSFETFSTDNDNPAVPLVPMKLCKLTSQPWIQIISPNGGENYVPGQQITVKWKTCNIPNTAILGINLEGFFVPLPASSFGSMLTVNDGVEVFTLPTQITWPGMQYGNYFKIHMNTTMGSTYITDLSDNLFSITKTNTENIYVYGVWSGVFGNIVLKSPNGNSWSMVASSSIPIGVITSVVNGIGNGIFFNNELRNLGLNLIASGGPTANDSFTSLNGAQWNSVGVVFPWQGMLSRELYSLTQHANKIFILGGVPAPYPIGVFPVDFYNDVWSSLDGINWTQTTSNAPWAGKSNFASISFNNKIWIFGGNQMTNPLTGLCCTGTNDVWSSLDGINWNLETSTAPWSIRTGHTALNFNGKMWILGGNGASCSGAVCNLGGYFGHSDVWSSLDGINWNLETNTAPWGIDGGIDKGRFNHCSVVFNNKMYVIGGLSGNSLSTPPNYFSDVWSSSDGVNWLQEASLALYSGNYNKPICTTAPF